MKMTDTKVLCKAEICGFLTEAVEILAWTDENQETANSETDGETKLDMVRDKIMSYPRYLFNSKPQGCKCPQNSEDDPRLILKRLMTLPLTEGSIGDRLRDYIVIRLVELAPELIVNYDENGQTALHLALLQENDQYMSRYELLQTMIDKIPEALERTGIKLHNGKTLLADGSKFQGTKMEAGTILGVAALSTSKNKLKVFNELLKVGFDIHQRTKKNDNILHTIIRHRHRNQKADVFKSTMQIVQKCIFRSDDRKTYQLLTDVNTANLTPVTQAALYGDFQMYEFFMTTKAMRRNVWSDGLTDVHEYDVTEIETIQPPNEQTGSNKHSSTKEENRTEHISVLEFVGHRQSQIVANEFVQFSPITEVIRCKWLYYRWCLLIWLLLHLLLTASLLATGICRAMFLSNDTPCLTCSSDNGILKAAFGLTILELFFGGLYLFPICCEVVRKWCKKRYTLRPSLAHAYSNLSFRILYCLLGPLMILDAGLALGDCDIPILPFALVIACYVFLFFLQVLETFSAFTVIIQKVIPDMLRFAGVMLILLSGFSISMFFVMYGADPNDDSFDSVETSIIKMVSIMIGLGEVDNLFTSRYPSVAIIIFILFVLLTTIMLLNSLIAIMSNTCSVVMTPQRGGNSVYYEHCILQRLSVILYIEHIFIIDCLLKEVGQMERSNFMTGKRRLLKIDTVTCVTADSEESPSISLTTQMFSLFFPTRKTTNRPRVDKRIRHGNDTPVSSKSSRTILKTVEIAEIEGMKCSHCGSERVVSTAGIPGMIQQ